MPFQDPAPFALSLLLACAAISACGSSPPPSLPSPSGAVAADRVDSTPSVGTYALTGTIPIVIRPAVSTGSAGGAGVTLQIGDGGAHPLLPGDELGWRVPALGLELGPATRDGIPGLKVRRYGESVFAPAIGQGSAMQEAGGGPEDVLKELTPRLMIGLNVPGVAIALIRDGEIAWRGHFGVKRSGGGERVDSLTVFEAASMSKPAYTYPFMKLVENGAIDLDTPLVRYLGEDYIPGDTLHRAITARMVLSHRSGLPNWRGDEGLVVRFTPGTQIGYSGEGFQFLQTVAERVTGKGTAMFTREALLDPLGLSSASYVWQEAYDEIMAAGHTAEGVPRPRRPYSDANAAYTLYVTPGDYARILIEIMRPDASGPHSLSASTKALMLEPQQKAPDREPITRGGQAEGEVHFALGWRMDRTPGGHRYWHSGSNSTGFQCYAEFDPATGDGIVIMTNSSSGSPLWRALMAAGGEP